MRKETTLVMFAVILTINLVCASQNPIYPSPTQCNGASWSIGLPDNIKCIGSVIKTGNLESDANSKLITGYKARLIPGDLVSMNKLCQAYTGDSSSYAISAQVHNYCNGCDQYLTWFSNGVWNVKQACYGTLNVQWINCATGCSLPPVCKSNSDCNDNNPNTEDICNNPGASSSTCSHNNIRCFTNTDCGTSDFIGSLFCSGNSIYQNYSQYICNNPGKGTSSCNNLVISKFKSACSNGQVCSQGSCSSTQCLDGIDNDNDGLTDSLDPGCWDSLDNSVTYNPTLNDESRATISCYTSAQCGKDGFVGNKYCSGNSVFQDYKTYTCNNPGKGTSSCTSSVNSRPSETCTDSCLNGQCINIACNSNSDCNDNNLYTYDECINSGSANSSCTHSTIKCINDNDCGLTGYIGSELCQANDVFKIFQTSKCLNPGTKQSSCKVTNESRFLLDCGESSCGAFGENYTRDGKIYHSRTCNNRGCSSGSCISNFSIDEVLIGFCPDYTCNTTIRCYNNTDCGTNNFVGLPTCSGSSVFQDYITYTCNSPGTSNASCSSSTSQKLVTTCSGSCINGSCSSSTCTSDSNCKSDYYDDSYCEDGDVYSQFHDVSCELGSCIENVSSKLMEECESGCSNGHCKGGGSSSDDTDSSPLVIKHNVTQKSSVIGSVSYAQDLNQTTKKISSTNASITPYFSSLWLWIFGIMIFLMIILLILFAIYYRRR